MPLPIPLGNAFDQTRQYNQPLGPQQSGVSSQAGQYTSNVNGAQTAGPAGHGQLGIPPYLPAQAPQQSINGQNQLGIPPYLSGQQQQQQYAPSPLMQNYGQSIRRGKRLLGATQQSIGDVYGYQDNLNQLQQMQPAPSNGGLYSVPPENVGADPVRQESGYSPFTEGTFKSHERVMLDSLSPENRMGLLQRERNMVKRQQQGIETGQQQVDAYTGSEGYQQGQAGEVDAIAQGRAIQRRSNALQSPGGQSMDNRFGRGGGIEAPPEHTGTSQSMINPKWKPGNGEQKYITFGPKTDADGNVVPPMSQADHHAKFQRDRAARAPKYYKRDSGPDGYRQARPGEDGAYSVHGMTDDSNILAALNDQDRRAQWREDHGGMSGRQFNRLQRKKKTLDRAVKRGTLSRSDANARLGDMRGSFGEGRDYLQPAPVASAVGAQNSNNEYPAATVDAANDRYSKWSQSTDPADRMAVHQSGSLITNGDDSTVDQIAIDVTSDKYEEFMQGSATHESRTAAKRGILERLRNAAINGSANRSHGEHSREYEGLLSDLPNIDLSDDNAVDVWLAKFRATSKQRRSSMEDRNRFTDDDYLNSISHI